MRFLFQFGAVLTILLAFVEVLSVVPEAWTEITREAPPPPAYTDPVLTPSDLPSPAPLRPPTPFQQILHKTPRVCRLFSPSASLFSLAAILWVLCRISKVQESEAPPSTAGHASAAPGDKP